MAKRKSRKQVALFERILDTEPGIKAKFADVNVAQVSIPGLQRKTSKAFMKLYPLLHVSEVSRLGGRLNVALAVMLRALREGRSSTGTRRAADEMKGSLALNSGPTFENQFNPSWANHTHPGAVDATTSPAAYLIDMLDFAHAHIESQGDDEKALHLKTRRPDLFDLVIDEQSMNREVTQVEVVNHVMERAIVDQRGSFADDPTYVEDQLLEVRYPFRHFPYETYWEQIRTVLAFNQLHISDITHLSDIDSPYFIQPGVHSTISNMALQQDSSIGPALRAILLEPRHFSGASEVQFNPQTRRLGTLPAKNAAQHAQRLLETATTFYRVNFGVAGYPTLQNVVNFCQALELTQDEMESLFGLAAYKPSLSENAGGSPAPVSPGLFVARFLNSGAVDPVAVESDDPENPQHHHFLNLSEDRCDRLNRLVRLAHVLKLSYSETDQVVCAIIDAERLVLTELRRSSIDDDPLWMTVNTVRGLGLFQFLRERFSCTAEEFAALMSDMGVYAVGEKRSHFDRVFNTDAAMPLVIDGTEFRLNGEDVESKRTVDLLCRGLGINMETFRYLSRLVMQGQGGERQTRSIKTFSAFYRIALLARLLSITTIELLSLMEVLSPEGLYALQLAGVPRNAMYENFSRTDTVNVIYAICQCVLWCQEQQLPISWLVQQLLPVETLDIVPQAFRTLFIELKSGLAPFRNFDQDMEEAGVPRLVSKRWIDMLSRIVDENGLIMDSGISSMDFDYLDYDNFAERDINLVIDQLASEPIDDDIQLPGLAPDELEHLKALVKGVVLRIRSQQWGVVQERLSHMLALSSERVIPVIYWAQGRVHTLMKTAVAFNPDMVESESVKEMVAPLLRMQRCAQVATQFDLSPALLSSLLKRGQRPRFSLRSTELTLHTLFLLERYTRCLRLAKQSEEQLLGYFSAIEGLGALTENERRLIKDIAADKLAGWLGWGIREVLDVAAVVTPDGIIRNLAQLLILVNTQQQCERTGLSAVSLMKLSRLTAYSDTQAHRSVAQEMLSSLRRDPEQRRDEVELRQSLASRCEVSESRLIARKNEGTEETKVSLTLLDMGNQPVSDIRVAWSTDLGRLLQTYSYTDENGVAEVTLQAGDQQGIAQVKGTYLLDGQAIAPGVLIDCDEASLRLLPIRGKPNDDDAKALSGGIGVYRFTAVLVDEYDNVGIDRRINWATEIGYFVDTTAGETLTDNEGRSVIDLRSQAHGLGEVIAWYAPRAGAYEAFNVTFEDKPYINSLVLTSWVVAGDDIKVEATILSLDGNPKEGQKVEWRSDPPLVIDVGGVSDDKGKATATLKGAATGELRVFAELFTEDDPPKQYHCQDLSIDVLADVGKVWHLGGEKWPMADGSSVGEYRVRVLTSGDVPVARYPVEWSVKEEGTKTYQMVTGADGIADFTLMRTTVSEPDEYLTVTATVYKQPAHEFEPVQVMPALELEIENTGQKVFDLITLEQPIRGNQLYGLVYRLADKHPLLNKTMQLHYEGRDSDTSLGLEFNPPLGSDNSFDGRELAWRISIKGTGLRNDVELKLGLWCKELNDAIWTDVVVKPASE